MGMVVRSNIMAVNSQRQLGMNNSQVTKALEKLSSGYRINRAGDDASGLAISEKMKAQIKGLDTASLNAQDGISLVQTAEGALTEVHNMLNRMVELATRAANGINSNDNRDSLQKEVEKLQDEITRIANSTDFNGTKPLLGAAGLRAEDAANQAAKAEVTQPTTPATTAKDGAAGTAATIEFNVGGFEGKAAGKVDVKLGEKVIGEVDVTEGMTDEEFATAVAGLTFKLDDGGTEHEFTGAVDSADKTKVVFTQKTPAVLDLSSAAVDGYKSGDDITVVPQEAAADTPATAAAGDAAAPDFSGATALKGTADGTDDLAIDASGLDGDAIQAALDKLAGGDDTIKGGDVSIEYDTANTQYVLKAGTTVIGTAATSDKVNGMTNTGGAKSIAFTDGEGNALGSISVTTTATTALTKELQAAVSTGVDAAPTAADDTTPGAAGADGQLVLQVGDTNSAFNQIQVVLRDMTAVGIKVDKVDISTLKGAQNAIQTIRDSIDYVSEYRAELGATQNRLEYSINNLDTTSENIQAANSRIRDTDMAKMMMEYTKVNVLTQSAQAMLAQANQQPQSVLQLLQ